MDFTRPVWTQTWPFEGGLNPSCRPHVCRLHTGKPMAPVPPAHSRKPHNSVLPFTSLGLPSFHPPTRDQVNAHKRVSLCASSTKGHLGFQPPSPPPREGQTSVLANFHCLMPWEFLFLAQDLWSGEPGMVLRPLPLRGGSSSTEVTLYVFNHYMWAWGQPVLHLNPFYPSHCGLFIALVIGVLFSLSSDDSGG